MARPKKVLQVPDIKIIDNSKEYPKEKSLTEPSVVVVFNKKTNSKKRMSMSFAKILINGDNAGKYKIL